MRAINKNNLLIGLAMLLAALGGLMLKPTNLIADQKPKINLETMIPKQFSEWKIDESIIPLQADPAQEALIKKIYYQTLARTYINQKGERVMLSVAYGGNLSEDMQVHRPEVCYKAQGFNIEGTEKVNIETGFGQIAGKRILAKLGNRIEPITYWIAIGDKVSFSSLQWKFEQFKYALSGKAAGGLLFRVSGIGETSEVQPTVDSFVKDLLLTMSTSERKYLIGNTNL
jgi:EpsI family protein